MAVAARGGASAKEIANVTGLPLPTVYRLVRELLDGDYLVHIREEKRFELGYKLHALGVSLHEQIGVSRQVRAVVRSTSRASPRLCAASVDMTRVRRPERAARTAVEAAVVVFPTPPLPVTRTTRAMAAVSPPRAS